MGAPDQIMVQVRFFIDSAQGRFQDALWFTQGEYAATTPDQIAAMKQARFDNWVNLITNPPAPPEE